jgi:hypothetical protein
MSIVICILMVASSGWGLFADDVYHEGAWARAALRGGDLVSLVVAVPLLAWSLWRARQGSPRATLTWAGALGYNVYNYAYFTFGAHFNDLFLAHIAILALSVWTLVFLLASLDAAALAQRFTPTAPTRKVATLLGVTAVVLAALWTYYIVRQMATGDLPERPPPNALHMVYATDLTIFVAAMAVTAVLLWRRAVWGLIGGTAMTLTAALYLVNLISTQAFQAHAHVRGVAAFSIGPISLAAVFWIAAAVMLGSVRTRRPRPLS